VLPLPLELTWWRDAAAPSWTTWHSHRKKVYGAVKRAWEHQLRSSVNHKTVDSARSCQIGLYGELLAASGSIGNLSKDIAAAEGLVKAGLIERGQPVVLPIRLKGLDVSAATTARKNGTAKPTGKSRKRKFDRRGVTTQGMLAVVEVGSVV